MRTRATTNRGIVFFSITFTSGKAAGRQPNCKEFRSSNERYKSPFVPKTNCQRDCAESLSRDVRCRSARQDVQAGAGGRGRLAIERTRDCRTSRAHSNSSWASLKGKKFGPRVGEDFGPKIRPPGSAAFSMGLARIDHLIISITPTRWPDGLIIVAVVAPTSSAVKSNPKSGNVVSDLISASLRPLTFTIWPNF